MRVWAPSGEPGAERGGPGRARGHGFGVKLGVPPPSPTLASHPGLGDTCMGPGPAWKEVGLRLGERPLLPSGQGGDTKEGVWHLALRCFCIPVSPCHGLCDLGPVTAAHFPEPHGSLLTKRPWHRRPSAPPGVGRSAGAPLPASGALGVSPSDPPARARAPSPGPASGDGTHLSSRLDSLPFFPVPQQILSGLPSEHL